MADIKHKELVTDYNAFAEKQKQLYGNIASFGAIGGLLGIGLGNHFSFNVVYSGLAGFVIGASIGKAVHDHQVNKEKAQQEKNNNKSNSGK